MRPCRSLDVRCALGRLALFGVALVLAGPASASPDTLRRGLANVTQAPFDAALSPITAGISTGENLDAVSPQPALQGLYFPFGWVGTTGLNLATAVYRAAAGAAEIVVGIVLFPFPDTDVPAFFRPGKDARALVSWKNPLGEDPKWVKYVPPFTPFTMDIDLGVRPEAELY